MASIAEYRFNFIHLFMSCSVIILNGFKSIDPTQYAIPLMSLISTFTFSIKLSSKTSATVKLQPNFSEIKGIAYCVGSIDLKPLRMITEQDFNKCMKLNLYSAVETIKGYQESLKKNKGSIVLFSTVAAQRGFTNHAIIA